MKRKLSAVLLFLFAASVIIPSPILAHAMSINAGVPALRGQWQRSEGPRAEGISLEYSYFVPSVPSPCPLVVLLGGAGEGTPSGKELEANDFANWSSDEFQARVFDADGMYIMILKAPEPVYFDTCPTAPMYSAISDFISKHNVDRERVIVGGWCLGASGAARLASSYPDVFSGLMLFSGRTVLAPYEARALRNTRVWLFCSKADTYSNYATFTLPSWNNIVAATADKNNIRLTSSDTAPRAALILNHHMWMLAEYDFSPSVLGNFKKLKTVDGSGNTVASPTVIEYMTMTKDGIARNTSPEEEASETDATPTDTGAATASDTGVTATDAGESIAETVSAQTTADSASQEDEKTQPKSKKALAAVTACAGAVCVILGAAIVIFRKKKS